MITCQTLSRINLFELCESSVLLENRHLQSETNLKLQILDNFDNIIIAIHSRLDVLRTLISGKSTFIYIYIYIYWLNDILITTITLK